MVHISFSEPGGKPVNEDYVLVRMHPRDHGTALCFLADGQGGRAHGSEAARIACESAFLAASDCDPDSLLEAEAWDDLLADVDEATKATGGFTTLVALAIDAQQAAGGSSGDSKAYFRLPGHSDLVEWTTRQHRNPPVGSGDCWFETFQHDVSHGGRLIILSDGAWKYSGFEALRAAFDATDLSTIVPGLRQAILQRSGTSLPDDFSVIVLDLS